jgi:hypothetical protein
LLLNNPNSGSSPNLARSALEGQHGLLGYQDYMAFIFFFDIGLTVIAIIA